jgi:glycosyltransferase 2 family protein
VTEGREPPPPPHQPLSEHPTGPHEHGHSVYEPGEFLDAPAEEVIAEAEVSLTRRFLNWRTIGGIVFALALVFLLFRVVLNVDFGRSWQLVQTADIWLLLAGLGVYYLTFPLRSLRWALILRRVGTPIPYRDATEILFLSWFVNCLVPAKLGDLYRAYLLRANYGASISRTVGTIFLERITDIVIIFALALAAGFWSFRNRNNPQVDALFVAGFVVASLLVIVLVVLRFQGRRITAFLPQRVAVLWERFHEGSTGALRPALILQVGVITTMVWALEGARVFFVIRSLDLASLDLPALNIGISSAIFVALAASLLTAIPLTPAGIGFVQAGIVWTLTLYGVSKEAATAVAVTDFLLSTLSVIVIGGILYAFSGMVRRAHGVKSGPAIGSSSPP